MRIAKALATITLKDTASENGFHSPVMSSSTNRLELGTATQAGMMCVCEVVVTARTRSNKFERADCHLFQANKM